jgi:hypothetical protein
MIIYKLFSSFVCDMLHTHYPRIAALYKKCNDFWKAKGPEYVMDFGGLFFTMAVNMDLGVPVMTVPHIDFLNLLYGVCIILVYGIAYYTSAASRLPLSSTKRILQASSKMASSLG